MTGTGAHRATPPEPPDRSGLRSLAQRWWEQLSRQMNVWLAGAGTFILIVILGLLLTSRLAPTAACAVPPVGDRAAAALGLPARAAAPEEGQAYRYDPGGKGDCDRPSLPADRLFVAISTEEYDDGAACGGFLDVKGPKGTVRVQVIDECSCPPGRMGLSSPAYERIAGPDAGDVRITYQWAVNPPLPGPLTVRMKDAISPDWFEVQILNHGNPLKSVEVRTVGDDGWRTTKHEFWGYWTVWGGMGPGPYDLRITDSQGHRAVVKDIELDPNSTQRTSVHMYRKAPPPAPKPTREPVGTTSPTPTAPPSPTATPTPTASSLPSDEPIVIAADPDPC